MNQSALGLAAAIAGIPQEPPETIPLDDDEELELGFCWGCWRLEVDEESSPELVVEELASDELVSDEVDEGVEFDDELLE
jgi:hypothetical protein